MNNGLPPRRNSPPEAREFHFSEIEAMERLSLAISEIAAAQITLILSLKQHIVVVY